MPFYIGSLDGILQDVKISLVEQRGDTFTNPIQQKSRGDSVHSSTYKPSPVSSGKAELCLDLPLPCLEL